MVLMTLEIPMHAATLVIMANPEYGTCKILIHVTVPVVLVKACPTTDIATGEDSILLMPQMFWTKTCSDSESCT